MEFQIAHPHQVRLLSNPKDLDAMIFGIYFKPPVLVSTGLTLKANNYEFTLHTEGAHPHVVTLMDKAYYVFETHQLAVDYDDRNKILALYLQYDDSAKALHVDMSLSWLPNRFPGRFNPLWFFPPDVIPSQHGIRVNTAMVPQRSPLWCRIRSEEMEITGTRAYKLMGFWVPTKKDNPDWSFDAPEEFTEQAKANMKHGTLSEDYAVMMYLDHYTDRCISLVGYHKAKAPYPIGWGASPDGLIDSKGAFGAGGVLEIKTSKYSLALEAYYFPQVYMEMIATERKWCDVVRYCKPHAHVYRIHRDDALEQRLVPMLKYAYRNRHRLQEIVFGERAFIDMRMHLRTLAAKMPYEKISERGTTATDYTLYKDGGRLT